MADYGEHSDGQGADPTTPAKGTAGGATERDTALFCCVFKHMTNNPEVDWEAVAADLGYKSGRVASVRFRQVRRKLGYLDISTTPRSAKNKKGATAGDSIGTGKKTPSKVTKSLKATTKGKKGVPQASESPADASPAAFSPYAGIINVDDSEEEEAQRIKAQGMRTKVEEGNADIIKSEDYDDEDPEPFLKPDPYFDGEFGPYGHSG